MKRILQVVACVSFSLSCQSMGIISYPETNKKSDLTANVSDYFLKISDNEYVLYHHEPMIDRSNSSIGRLTSTHVKTYGGVYPDSIRNIQTINYAESNTILFKDYSNNCFLDIYESMSNPNKCRIIGINGQNIHIGSSCFSTYDVALKEESFVGNEDKRIFVDNGGTYIVSTARNPLNEVIDYYEKNKKFNFKGSVIKISAIYGKRLIDDLGPHKITSQNFLNGDFPVQTLSLRNSNETSNRIFLLNCSFKTPAAIGSIFAPLTKLYPAMMQIEQITGVKLTTPPPSKKSVIKRISDILGLGIITDALAMKDGKVYLVDIASAAIHGIFYPIIYNYDDACSFYKSFHNYIYPLQNFIPIAYQGVAWEEYTKAFSDIYQLVCNGGLKGHLLDTSEEAQTIRKQIAAQPWDNI